MSKVDISHAISYAKEMISIWGYDDEQIEAHMESEGFSPNEIDAALDAICIEVLGDSCDGSDD